MRIKFYTEVEKVEQKQRREYHPGTWAEAKGESQLTYSLVNIGYFLHLKGSHEALFVGLEEPQLKAGQRVSVTIQPE